MSEPSIETAIQHFRQGEHQSAYQMIQQVLRSDPGNIQGWAWLAYMSENIEQKRVALRRALVLAPDDERILNALQRLNTPHQIHRAAEKGVYISYARPNELFAFNLAHGLRSSGVNVWLDIVDVPDNIDWYTAITHALARCGIMLAILSPAALATPDLHAEWRYYEEKGKLVLPLLAEDCGLPDQSLWLETVDFRPGADQSLTRLLSLLGYNTVTQS
ncbi:MAG: TIR domain-containing protein [Anaerolineae bacterium]|nr:TIR domain-containing protein [Anaerolineae bacterium]